MTKPSRIRIKSKTEIEAFKPKMITAVHCETPSGTLNPLEALGRMKKDLEVPLLYVDAVSSIGGAPVLTDAWHIDLCLGGSQKCLSSLPDMAFLSVSDAAWEIIDQVDYSGYDALKPFRTAQATTLFSLHPQLARDRRPQRRRRTYFRGRACRTASSATQRLPEFCRQQMEEMGLTLFPSAEAVPAPTVTAVKVPQGITWRDFDAKLRQQGLVVAGSYGPLADKVFRLGHMGTQADRNLVVQALEAIRKALP